MEQYRQVQDMVMMTAIWPDELHGSVLDVTTRRSIFSSYVDDIYVNTSAISVASVRVSGWAPSLSFN